MKQTKLTIMEALRTLYREVLEKLELSEDDFEPVWNGEQTGLYTIVENSKGERRKLYVVITTTPEETDEKKEESQSKIG